MLSSFAKDEVLFYCFLHLLFMFSIQQCWLDAGHYRTPYPYIIGSVSPTTNTFYSIRLSRFHCFFFVWCKQINRPIREMDEWRHRIHTIKRNYTPKMKRIRDICKHIHSYTFSIRTCYGVLVLGNFHVDKVNNANIFCIFVKRTNFRTASIEDGTICWR